MKSRTFHIVIDPKQFPVVVTENHGTIYHNFEVDTFRSNYDIKPAAGDAILKVFHEYQSEAKRGCYYAVSATFVCSPKLPDPYYTEMFDAVMAILRNPASYVSLDQGVLL